MTDAVSYRVDNGVAWLTIERPEARNALNAAAREGLFAGARRFNEDSGAAVLVLTGAGDKAFCAGGDLKEMADTALTVPPPDFAPQFGRNIEIAKPTIAAVNGIAWAGGFMLAMSCDLCVAAEGATFAISEVKVGRGAPWAAPLSWLIPPRIALQILLTGDPITAARACEVGLVNEVVPPGELHVCVQQLAERIAANAPLSVLAAKRTAYLSQPEKFDEAERIWAPVYHSADAQEGPAAFRDKRKPVWTGRLPARRLRGLGVLGRRLGRLGVLGRGGLGWGGGAGAAQERGQAGQRRQGGRYGEHDHQPVVEGGGNQAGEELPAGEDLTAGGRERGQHAAGGQ
jgi:enoyl-CoA hydratase/carnithine racemase